MDILIIGVEPPCVRCHRTVQLVTEAAQQFGNKIEIKKISLHSEEAKQYGKIVTPHDIGELTGLTVDENKIRELAKTWSKELDNELMPCKEKAEEIGYLMTPVLIINGQVKSMGFVPDKEKIQEWIKFEL